MTKPGVWASRPQRISSNTAAGASPTNPQAASPNCTFFKRTHYSRLHNTLEKILYPLWKAGVLGKWSVISANNCSDWPTWSSPALRGWNNQPNRGPADFHKLLPFPFPLVIELDPPILTGSCQRPSGRLCFPLSHQQFQCDCHRSPHWVWRTGCRCRSQQQTPRPLHGSLFFFLLKR